MTKLIFQIFFLLEGMVVAAPRQGVDFGNKIQSTYVAKLFSRIRTIYLSRWGLILLIVSLFRNSSKSRLKETGIPVEGIVFEQGFEETINVSSDFFSPVKDKITIRFVTLSGEWITEAINQDFSFLHRAI